MLDDLSEKTVLVFDPNGSFIYVAQRLARDFGRVLYYKPWENGSYVTYNAYVVGQGVPGIERVHNIWEYYDEIDLFYFCDLLQGHFQEWLRARGKLVFGAGRGEDMELYRDRMKAHQEELGLPINEYEVIQGLDALREYLQENDNKFIKTNLMRGHFESFKHETYKLTKPLLDEWEHTLGIYKDAEIFIVEEPIEAIAEVGYDGFVILGRYPAKTMLGIEIKDTAYCGVILDYHKLPEQVLEINDKLSETFMNYGYRGVYTNEIRIGIDRKGYLIDQTCRQPEPPTCLQLEIFENYSEVVWQVAQGRVPEIKTKFKYGVQIILKSEYATTEPQAIYFPSQYSDFIKISNLAIQDDVYYFIPQMDKTHHIGSVIGLGNTLQEAIEQASEIAEEVKGYMIEFNSKALEEVHLEIEKLQKAGIDVF